MPNDYAYDQPRQHPQRALAQSLLHWSSSGQGGHSGPMRPSDVQCTQCLPRGLPVINMENPEPLLFFNLKLFPSILTNTTYQHSVRKSNDIIKAAQQIIWCFRLEQKHQQHQIKFRQQLKHSVISPCLQWRCCSKTLNSNFTVCSLNQISEWASWGQGSFSGCNPRCLSRRSLKFKLIHLWVSCKVLLLPLLPLLLFLLLFLFLPFFLFSSPSFSPLPSCSNYF